MKIRSNLTRNLIDIVTLIVVGVLFIVPFVFIFLTASKPQSEAALFEFSLPSEFLLFQNLWEVIQFRDYRMLLALWNSTVLTVGSVILIVMGYWRRSPRFFQQAYSANVFMMFLGFLLVGYQLTGYSVAD